ncbi:unnamed protein product [Tenebrio molitor]|nr:unnamed protein product [Tenebrio molitor]
MFWLPILIITNLSQIIMPLFVFYIKMRWISVPRIRLKFVFYIRIKY